MYSYVRLAVDDQWANISCFKDLPRHKESAWGIWQLAHSEAQPIFVFRAILQLLKPPKSTLILNIIKSPTLIHWHDSAKGLDVWPFQKEKWFYVGHKAAVSLPGLNWHAQQDMAGCDAVHSRAAIFYEYYITLHMTTQRVTAMCPSTPPQPGAF